MFTSALAAWRLWSSSEPELVRQLKGGLTNHSYLISAKDSQWVLRINADNSAELDLNRKLELQILSLPGMELLGPRLAYCDPDGKFLVLEYLPGTIWKSADGYQQKDLIALAGLLKRIHQLAAVDGVLDSRQKAANYWQSIDRSSPLAMAINDLQPAVRRHFDQARALCQRSCLCHNDLLAENLIVAEGGGLYAIDWEYAAMGDPYFDLAVIVEGHSLSPKQGREFLLAYIGDVSESVFKMSWIRLAHSRVIYAYLTLLWHVVQSESRSGGVELCEEKLEKLTRLISENDVTTQQLVNP